MVENNKKGIITKLITYPLKGAHGNETKSVILKKEGFLNDRIFSLVDKSSMKKVNMRESTKLYNIKCEEIENFSNSNKIFKFVIPSKIDTESLIEELVVIDSKKNYKKVSFKLYDAPRNGIEIEGDCILKINDYLEKDYLLVFCQEPEEIIKWENQNKFISDISTVKNNFYDEGTILIVQEEDVNELNELLVKSGNPIVEARAFRPNIIISGYDAQSIEKAKSICIRNILFRRMSNCGRCKIVTYNFEKGEMNKNKEPLETLADYRFDNSGNKTTFGGYYFPESYTKDSKSNFFIKEDFLLELGDEVKLNFE